MRGLLLLQARSEDLREDAENCLGEAVDTLGHTARIVHPASLRRLQVIFPRFITNATFCVDVVRRISRNGESAAGNLYV